MAFLMSDYADPRCLMLVFCGNGAGGEGVGVLGNESPYNERNRGV